MFSVLPMPVLGATGHVIGATDRPADTLAGRLGEKNAEYPNGSGGLLLGGGFLEDPHDVAFLHDQVIDTVNLDLGSRPLAEQDAVADLDVQRHQLARLITATGADGNDFTLRGFFPRAVRDDNAARALLLGIEALDDNAVVKRTKLHVVLLGS